MTRTLSDEAEDLDRTSKSESSSKRFSSYTSRIKSGPRTSSGGDEFPTGGAGCGRESLDFFGGGGFLGSLRLGFAPLKEQVANTPLEVEGLGSGSGPDRI